MRVVPWAVPGVHNRSGRCRRPRASLGRCRSDLPLGGPLLWTVPPKTFVTRDTHRDVALAPGASARRHGTDRHLAGREGSANCWLPPVRASGSAVPLAPHLYGRCGCQLRCVRATPRMSTVAPAARVAGSRRHQLRLSLTRRGPRGRPCGRPLGRTGSGVTESAVSGGAEQRSYGGLP